MTKIPMHPSLPWLEERTIFYTRHGSHAYGTNIATSDEDFKGVAIPPPQYFHGFNLSFAQAETKAHKVKKDEGKEKEGKSSGSPEEVNIVGEEMSPDAVIYDIRKFFRLAADCNPSIVEVFWTDPSDWIRQTPLGERMVAEKRLFLSKKAKFTFSGYANAQMKRINTHYRWLKNPPKAPPQRSDYGLPERTVIPADQLAAAKSAVQKVVDGWEWKDLDNLDESMKIEIKTSFFEKLLDITKWSDDVVKARVWNAAAHGLGFDTNFIELLDMERRYTGHLKDWQSYNNWKVKRNPQRAVLEASFGYDTKHAMHLVRLMKMCEEIMLTGEVTVKRPDREELLTIRDGAWGYETLVEWSANQDKKLDALYKTTTAIPDKPDRSRLNKLCTELVELSFKSTKDKLW